MSLLTEIQNEAVDSKSDLGALLRKCKVLATQLNSQPLENWLIWESNGYDNEDNVPAYRIWPLEVRGDFSGPYGLVLNNQPIPMICLPKMVREEFNNYKCLQSISSIENMTRHEKNGTFRVSTGDLAVNLTNVNSDLNCLEAWAEVHDSRLFEILNAVRNRILDFSLAISKEYPDAGEITTQKDIAIAPERVNQIFYMTVHGGSPTFVTASNSPFSISVVANDISSLEGLLRQNAVNEEDIKALRDALNTDAKPQSEDRFGPKVANWIGDMIKKAAEGGWEITVSTAGSLLSDAILKYYGLK